MTALEAQQRFRYSRLIAPVVLVLFAIGWYRFSVVYIQAADDQLVANNNLAVYVPIQQVQGYLGALLWATYLTVAVGLIVFVYFLAKFLMQRPRG